jgi:hypothetical protein
MINMKSLAAAALILGGLAGVASAQTAPEPAPKADAGTTIQAACIDENDHYKRNGKQPMFVVEFENKCEQRMRCKVFVYITSAKGATQGRGTIVLAAKSGGAAAKDSYAIKVKMIGGNSQSTRECRVY